MAFITIKQQNFAHNINLVSKKAGGIDKIMAVLKDNAYGHGIELIAKLCIDLGIKKIAVKNFKEASKLKMLFEEILVLVDHPTKEQVSPNISLSVHSIEALKEVLPNSAIHLSLDTGMHRNGLREDEYQSAIEIIKEKKLRLKGIFTHFRSADEFDSEYFWQEKNYQEAKRQWQKLVKENALPSPAYHSCNSAALLRREKDLDDDYARCGIAMYGYVGLPCDFAKYDLKPVMSLWAQKLSSRVLKKGQKIGYGGAYEAKGDELISTYDVGYGDGFFRYDGRDELRLSEKNILVGKVSMDSLFIKGNEQEVCLFHDASVLAEEFNTIVYDVMTKLSPTLTRKII
jgi:alanine racemase